MFELFSIPNDSNVNESMEVVVSACRIEGEHLTFSLYLK